MFYFRYIYGGSLSLDECDTLRIFKVLVAASELNLQELVDYLQLYIIKNDKNWMDQNFSLIYQTSFENNSFLELQKYCVDLISKRPDKILKSISFSSIPEKLLTSIIKNNNHQMSEIQVWKYELQWGLVQNPELSSDPAIISSIYNPIEWKSDRNYGVTKDSFIFSENGDDFNKHILSRVINENYSTLNDHSYGPSFGGADLILRRDSEHPTYTTFTHFLSRSSEGIFDI
ncbi:hypothetical protein RclHR1_03620004 [Rhizophagus clarus]|uniref:BACK domain-containing protein n=1 Tax=Rhizophagus clarus TaxID=94130 RepID=A0A2Z6RBD5_9GLOM|nr:hypothetical protein RclHR1_03620004 [Rhizophagus clarus]